MRGGDVHNNGGLIVVIVDATNSESTFAVADYQRDPLVFFPAETASSPEAIVGNEVLRRSGVRHRCWRRAVWIFRQQDVRFTDEVEAKQNDGFFCGRDDREVLHAW